MKIRTIKKLIRQYPPIIEIRLPERLNTQDVLEQLKYMKENKLPKYLKESLVVIFPLEEPTGILKINSDIPQKKLDEFKEMWEKNLKSLNVLTFSEGSKIEWIEPSFVTIHSALKDTLFIYEKTKERLNKLIRKYNSEK